MDRKILSLLLVITFIYEGSAQFGFHSIAGYNFFEENKIEQSIQPSNSLHYSLGPSYWFRLKSKRIEFNPAILFDYNNSNYSKNDVNATSLSEYNFTLGIPILFYPLDFGNDCNCPTFNKSGQFFQKGFYFMLYPALPYSIKKINRTDSTFSKSFANFQLGIGAGIDIGINKKWTLSPSLMVSKFFLDNYSLDPTGSNLLEDGDSRFRIDLMIRFIWFAKKKRY